MGRCEYSIDLSSGRYFDSGITMGLIKQVDPQAVGYIIQEKRLYDMTGRKVTTNYIVLFNDFLERFTKEDKCYVAGLLLNKYWGMSARVYSNELNRLVCCSYLPNGCNEYRVSSPRYGTAIQDVIEEIESAKSKKQKVVSKVNITSL